MCNWHYKADNDGGPIFVFTVMVVEMMQVRNDEQNLHCSPRWIWGFCTRVELGNWEANCHQEKGKTLLMLKMPLKHDTSDFSQPIRNITHHDHSIGDRRDDISKAMCYDTANGDRWKRWRATSSSISRDIQHLCKYHIPTMRFQNHVFFLCLEKGITNVE